jgi:hypothetical protein
VALAAAVGEVVHTVEWDARSNAGVSVLEAGLELAIVGRERGERGQVAARRSARDRHELGVAAVLCDMRFHPGDRALHIDDLIGEGGPRTQPIVDGDADPAARRELIDEG